MRKKVSGRSGSRGGASSGPATRTTGTGRRIKAGDPANQPGKGNDVRLMRPKSRFKSARAAWSDIASKFQVNANQVRPKHTAKAWRWVWK